jgi:glycerophosphoryl diester phosphodiesterase
MKKAILLSLFVLFSIYILFAQSRNHLLVLDNYTIHVNQKGAVIGKVISPSGGAVSLIKDPSGLFEIGKDDNIKLKKGKQLKENSPVSYEVVLKSGSESKSFELVKDDFLHNKVIAHRGAWRNMDYSHNSMSSLKHAVELGCEGSELDVWLSSDDVVVLSHDPSIGGKVVEETTAKELSETSLKNGDFVPALEEYINYIKTQNKTKLVIEIKGTNKGKAIADSVVQLVHRLKAQAWVDYISFGIQYLVRVKELDPAAKVLYLGSDKTLEELKAAGMDGVDFHYSLFQKDKDLVGKAKSMGLLTNAWTVDDEGVMKEMLGFDIDFITTDEPEMLFKLINNK